MAERDDAEHPIPPEWRATLSQVIDACVEGDFGLQRGIEGVAPVDADTAQWIAQSVAAYGAPLAPLDAAVWETARCRWMDGYWELLVDLTTTAEPVSDLVLHARRSDGDPPLFTIRSVHVP
jgi:hypothetical protein